MKANVARTNMIKQQVRTVDVTDERVLAVINEIPRAHFVPKLLQKLAYADTMLSIGYHQVMMLPSDEARMLQALTIKPTDKILEVGTGTSYVTALLAKLGKEVISVDILEEFTQAAPEKLAAHHIKNVRLVSGDAACGWAVDAPYDVIAITGSVAWLTLQFRESLRIGGRLFAIVGTAPIMEARLITRLDDDKWDVKQLFETNLKPLINAPEKEAFIF